MFLSGQSHKEPEAWNSCVPVCPWPDLTPSPHSPDHPHLTSSLWCLFPFLGLLPGWLAWPSKKLEPKKPEGVRLHLELETSGYGGSKCQGPEQQDQKRPCVMAPVIRRACSCKGLCEQKPREAICFCVMVSLLREACKVLAVLLKWVCMPCLLKCMRSNAFAFLMLALLKWASSLFNCIGSN